MKEFRITLISDPTDEYPHNKNNNFKVRLPVRLNLEDNQWQASCAVCLSRMWVIVPPSLTPITTPRYSNIVIPLPRVIKTLRMIS